MSLHLILQTTLSGRHYPKLNHGEIRFGICSKSCKYKWEGWGLYACKASSKPLLKTLLKTIFHLTTPVTLRRQMTQQLWVPWIFLPFLVGICLDYQLPSLRKSSVFVNYVTFKLISMNSHWEGFSGISK